MKIMKHARDAVSPTAIGLLLGLDLDGVLEVSNCFPLPPSHSSQDEEDKASAKVNTSKYME